MNLLIMIQVRWLNRKSHQELSVTIKYLPSSKESFIIKYQLINDQLYSVIVNVGFWNDSRIKKKNRSSRNDNVVLTQRQPGYRIIEYKEILIWQLLNRKLANVVWKFAKKAIEDTNEESKLHDF